jgi:four helix bundle protein
MRVYQAAVQMNRQVAGLVGVLERKDRDLLRQLKRAARSVALNIAEGLGNAAGNRELRLQTALGSAREVMACLDVADAWGYLGPEHKALTVRVDGVVARLFKLVRAGR